MGQTGPCTTENPEGRFIKISPFPSYALLTDAGPRRLVKCPCPKIIPDRNGIYHGAFVADTVTSDTVRRFERMSGQSLDIALKFLAFATGLHFPAMEARLMSQRGSALYIKLEPWSWKGKNDASYSLRDIVAGKHDAMIQRFARGAAAFGKPVFVSFGHEMNGNWYPWSGDAALYVKAWKHVHGLISKIACNVTWVWNVNIDFPRFASYYPGAPFVDWVAVDGYNVEDWGNSWRAFSQLFSTSLKTLGAYNKPIMIGEFASDARSRNDERVRKPAFIRDAVTRMAASHTASSGPLIHAFVYFNIDKREHGKQRRWALSTPVAQNVYRGALRKFNRLFAKGIQTACDSGATPPPSRPVQSLQPQTLRSAQSVPISSIRKGEFSFNGGRVARKPDGSYVFSARRAKDPGFGIVTGNYRLKGQTKLTFDVQGSIRQHGNYARLVVHVYDTKDGDSAPSVSFDPVTVAKNSARVTVPLGGSITRMKKIQFMLITDRGSCDVVVKNLRLE